MVKRVGSDACLIVFASGRHYLYARDVIGRLLAPLDTYSRHALECLRVPALDPARQCARDGHARAHWPDRFSKRGRAEE